MLTWIQIIIAIIVVYVIFEKFRQRRLGGSLPGPPTVPFFGNALLFQGYGIEDFVCIAIRLQEEFSNLFRLWLGRHLMVYVADPASLETIYKSNDNLNKSILYEFFTDYSRGVVVAGGEKWRGLRKVVNTTFHHSNMENYQKILNDCSQILCQVLEKKCDGPIFNMDPIIHRCMLQVICSRSTLL
ncbi:cytochrome P450 4d2-like [Nilaparvata lugens]|uniref:cytochrome P450 4d2-like n=1 Tax=Nilaparvata lugens TaxID=108931 RepID=UPI00193E206C|nr:cytochrome P450 4d2-like [Nilaparvata lugens]